MQRKWLVGVFSLLVFQSLVISFQVAASEPVKNGPQNCQAQLVLASATLGDNLSNILRVRIMPAGSDPISWSSTHESFLLVPPEPAIEGAEPGQAQGLIKLGKLGTFAVFVRPSANGVPRIVMCRANDFEQCVFGLDLSRGEKVRSFFMLKQETDETVIQVETNFHQFLLKITR